MARWFLSGLFFSALLVLSGCDSGPKTVKVAGAVKLDDKPLDDGKITFEEAGSVPDTLPVKNGKFEGQVKPGKKTVKIYAFKKGEKAKMDKVELEGTDKLNYIPSRFNSQSKITADVTDSGINPAEFKVESE